MSGPYDYSSTPAKGPLGAVYPDNAVNTTWRRTEPLITPEQLRTRHLFGIPLVSNIVDPITKRAMEFTDDMIRDQIEGAVSDVETDCSIDIFPVQRSEKYAFDREDYLSFGYLRLLHRPVATIDEFHVTPANNVDVFTVPLEWTETSNLIYGQVNLIPIGIALNGSVYGGGMVTGVGAGAAAFLAILQNQNWIPAFWRVLYTTGYPDGQLPRAVNDLIGTIAAIRILSALAATYARSQSASIGMDGMSQSVSTPGPQLWETRIAKLEEERARKRGIIRKMYGQKLFTGQV